MITSSSQPDNPLISSPTHTSYEIGTFSSNKSRLPDDLDPEMDELAWKEWLLFEAWRVGMVG